MKKVLTLLLVLMLVLGCTWLSGCGEDTGSSSGGVDYSSNDDEHSGITKSEAESEAASALFLKLKAMYYYADEYYDISQTRYSVASVTKHDNGYEVTGTYSLYDKYGNYKKKCNFSVFVDNNGYGTVTEY